MTDSDPWWAGMTGTSTPHAGRCWWGWGTTKGLVANGLSPEQMIIKPPSVAEVNLPPPRLNLGALPDMLQAFCTDDKFERLLHSSGRDMIDIVRNIHGEITNPIDLVAFPRDEDEVLKLLQFCSSESDSERIAVVPFGGGSSVVQGVSSPPHSCARFRASISVDLCKMARLLEVDKESMCVRVQAGIYGPALEALLKQHGLTLRHFPQSFEFSAVGGWLATRAGGHFATGPTHIDELVESVRVVSPAGVTETPRLPGSGAGPAEHRHYIGSEGIYGVITEAWLRVRPRPTQRASATVLFQGRAGDACLGAFLSGAEAARRVVQSGLQPANLRLIDGPEMSRVTGRSSSASTSALLLGFESSEATDLDAQMRQALELCTEPQLGGVVEGGVRDSWTRRGGSGEREGVAGKWGTSFMAGGYMFSAACCGTAIVNTFETAITWDKFPTFHAEVVAAVREAIRTNFKDGQGDVTCRLTHIYPDGPAPYYTIIGAGDVDVDHGLAGDRRCAQWLAVKEAATSVMLKHGATSTHHHAVGRLHRPHYERERGGLFEATLRAVKAVHDPRGVMNPDVLIKSSGSKDFETSEMARAKL